MFLKLHSENSFRLSYRCFSPFAPPPPHVFLLKYKKKHEGRLDVISPCDIWQSLHFCKVWYWLSSVTSNHTYLSSPICGSLNKYFTNAFVESIQMWMWLKLLNKHISLIPIVLMYRICRFFVIVSCRSNTRIYWFLINSSFLKWISFLW